MLRAQGTDLNRLTGTYKQQYGFSSEMRAMSRKQLIVAQSQAESVKQLVETVNRQAETNARQFQLLETLIGKL